MFKSAAENFDLSQNSWLTTDTHHTSSGLNSSLSNYSCSDVVACFSRAPVCSWRQQLSRFRRAHSEYPAYNCSIFSHPNLYTDVRIRNNQHPVPLKNNSCSKMTYFASLPIAHIIINYLKRAANGQQLQAHIHLGEAATYLFSQNRPVLTEDNHHGLQYPGDSEDTMFITSSGSQNLKEQEVLLDGG